MDGHDERHSVGAGEFCEFAIYSHPRVDRSAPPPWHDFDWPAIFEHLDGGGEPPRRQYEEVARHLGKILNWIVTGDRPDAPPNLFRVAMRTAMLAQVLGLPLSPTVSRAVAQAKYRARAKAKKDTTAD